MLALQINFLWKTRIIKVLQKDRETVNDRIIMARVFASLNHSSGGLDDLENTEKVCVI